jgi:hypothetical protein
VFDAADRMAVALSGRFPGALQLTNGTDFMVAAAVNSFETVAASIEFVRNAAMVDSKISAQVRTASDAIMTAAPLLITPRGVAATDVDNLLTAAPPLNCTHSDPTAVPAREKISGPLCRKSHALQISPIFSDRVLRPARCRQLKI